METAGSYITTGLANGIELGQSGVINAAISVMKQAIAAAKRTAGIASPSKVTKYFGQMLSAGLAGGITSAADQPISAAAALASNVTAAIGDISSTIDMGISGTMQGLDMMGQSTNVVSSAGAFTYAPNIVNNINSELDISRVNRLQLDDMFNQMRSRGLAFA
jgi:hypothetical protein